MEPHTYESYPTWMALTGIGTTVAIYVLGAYVLSGLGLLAPILYLAYCALVELSILRGSCIDCYYYGKTCGMGRGRLCALLFQKGDPERFANREGSIRDILPDIVVPVIPLLGGIVILVLGFDWAVLVAMLLIVLLASLGAALVRSALACRHCAQRELGCPAQELFSRRNT